MKFGSPNIVRSIDHIVMVLLVGGVFWLGFFLYQNFYYPMTQAIATAELRARVASVVVNRERLSNVLKTLAERQTAATTDWSKLPDPFTVRAVPVATPEPSAEPGQAP